MATYTGSAATSNKWPRYVHSGLNVMCESIVLPSATDASVFLMGKIPAGARIVDVWVFNPNAGTDTHLWAVGTSQDEDVFLATESATTVVQHAKQGLPHDVSVVDTAVDQWVYAQIKLDGTLSTTTTISMGVFYQMDHEHSR